MTYLELHELLQQAFSPDPPELPLAEGLTLLNLDFVCEGPKRRGLRPASVPEELARTLPPETDLSSLFTVPDDEIPENLRFRYHLIRQSGEASSSKAIILLHGFNEKHWHKYLPMAAALARRTGKCVVLFPIAFHMNRTPAIWNDPRIMRRVSQWRKSVHPLILESSLSNAAISFRIQEDPSRFFWSGLESFENVIDLVRSIRHGRHPAFAEGASVDFFTYSIGTFLGEVIMLTDQDSLFGSSRLVAFCGGPVFNRLSPVSKFILDSQAAVDLYSFLVEHLDSHRRADPHLDEFLSGPGVGASFRAMLNYRLDREYREDRLRSMADRIKALALAKDQVVPPFEVINTLKGAARDIPIEVTVADPDYPYRHEDPFPAVKKHEAAVDRWFELIMGELSDFLK